MLHGSGPAEDDGAHRGTHMARAMQRTPTFPLTAHFDDGERWEFADTEDLACNLEWLDSSDADEPVVTDALGRRVQLKIEACRVLRCELDD
jgi:hypothetical protein